MRRLIRAIEGQLRKSILEERLKMVKIPKRMAKKVCPGGIGEM